MAYVPIVPPAPPPPPSPRTRELSALLAKVLEEYRKAHPSVTGAEIRAAMSLAGQAAGPGRARLAAVLGAVVGLLVALGVSGVFFLQRGAGGAGSPEAMPLIVAAVIAFLGIILVLVKVLTR